MLMPFSRQRNGASFLGHFAEPTGITTSLSHSRASLCGTWKDGTRRSIRMKILLKRLLSGSHRAPTGASAIKAGAQCESCSTWIASATNLAIQILGGGLETPKLLGMKWI